MSGPSLTYLVQSAVGVSLEPERALRTGKESPEPVAVSADNSKTHGVSQELFHETVRVFGAPERARIWLMQSLPSLDGFSPAETAARPGGEEQVRDLLLRIEHGIFS